MIPVQQAEDAADMLIANLFDGAVRAEVTGALRRILSFRGAGNALNPDWTLRGIELVVIPLITQERVVLDPRVHGKPYGKADVDMFERRLEVLGYGFQHGEGFVQFAAPLAGGEGTIPCRIWLANLDNFGAVMFQRTGTESAVRRALTPQSEGGWLLDGLAVNENGLYGDAGEIVTPTESVFFHRAFRRKWVEPHLRAQMGLEPNL